LAPAPLTIQTDGPGEVLWGGYTVAWKTACGELSIRTRQTGDEIHLPGGRKTVKKLLIDRKIPKEKRDFMPIVLLNGQVAAVGSVVCVNEQIEIKERKT